MVFNFINLKKSVYRIDEMINYKYKSILFVVLKMKETLVRKRLNTPI